MKYDMILSVVCFEISMIFTTPLIITIAVHSPLFKDFYMLQCETAVAKMPR